MIRRPPRSTLSSSSAASDVYKRQVCWQDVQAAFKKAGHGREMGDNDLDQMMHRKVTLMLKIEDIPAALEGEWRMYCKGTGKDDKPFSYGMYITDVEELAPEGHVRRFGFRGRSRADGKFELTNGVATWNEHHTGRVRLQYTENWLAQGASSSSDDMVARLKSNGKFECESSSGFIQKARREDTLPDDAGERMLSKYYIGDRDAAFEVMPFGELCGGLGMAGLDEMLAHVFFVWPTLPTGPKTWTRYGQEKETWGLTVPELKQAVVGGGVYDEGFVQSIVQELSNCNTCEFDPKQGAVLWPDVQHVFRRYIGDKADEIQMLDPLCTLTLKIPEDQIVQMLKGEWRMFCRNMAGGRSDSAFSYGLIIDRVNEVEVVGRCKKFTFTGRPRQRGKYQVKDGTAVWNEFGNGRLFIQYTESWPNGTDDHLRARLKCNGKFACESTAGFVQKARKEETLPTQSKRRLESKYYTGDTDAAVSVGEE
eukprot:TRINITY_DN5298_c0_g1_i3.p1 TRINITY_DN5298_c0_g1~~TRINITY_DN5298_c0_g1_i3.p1  ORF type:complete len:480 (+),score=131.34 TRINITY_DN5298_c0_g1_i3:66-1505(+)